MNTNKVEKLNKVFNKYTRSKKIHEAIVFVESGNGEFSWSKNYGDINFDMLGVVIKKVTGTTLSEAFEKFIFKPLGLNKTYLPVKENDFVPCIYNGDKALHRPKFIASSEASGGCISTAREMMVFIKGFFNGTLFPKGILEDLTIYNKLPITMGPIQYGGGHMKIKLDGLFMPFEKNDELLGHSGSTGSLAFYYPQRDIFFVGNVNQMCSPSIPIRLVCQLAMAVR